MKHTVVDLVPCCMVQLSDVYDIYCLIDERDREWALRFRWNFIWKRHCGSSLYARRNIGADRTTIYLHRELMLHVTELPVSYTDQRVVDHVNGNTLDNRRANLRWVTHKQNRRNIHAAWAVPSLVAIAAMCPVYDPAIPF